MRRLIIVLSLIGTFMASSITAHADRSYQFTGQPLTLKASGTHLTITSYELLKSPLPAFDTADTNELERYLIVHVTVSLMSSIEDEHSVDSDEYELFSGPNSKDILSKSDHISKLLKSDHYLLTMDGDDRKVKNGHSIKIDLGFTVYPDDEYILDTNIGFTGHHNYVHLNQIKSSNGVTAE
ncbi:hypothetical protein HC026_11675 [Lactobacillus sp. LC28-10]|uniref:Uncharacterized protein n=1 Tax=Secundilactobacillus angelensis TaxID=2722706 RepID=A0ABX1L2Y0_9LACO|nr:hypothetical protein [Secundilactobacillus angelensis]MCH5463159.1 hypothetical protein [Secundilactobacillus angelensis]NLR19548.1 hypothetical protein [Secundilactobacillus angelensis]